MSAVGNACTAIRNAMEKAMEIQRTTLPPSTALAIGHFNNFIVKVYEALDDRREITIDQRSQEYEDFSLIVLIPKTLRELESNRLKRIVRDLRQVSVRTEFRGFPFYVQGDVDVESTKKLELLDIPTTLLASEEIIEMLMAWSAVGESIEEAKLERREIDNFRKTLNYLKSKNAYDNLEIRSLLTLTKSATSRRNETETSVMTPNLTVDNDMVVTLDYVLTLESGEVVETTKQKMPMRFLAGHDEILPACWKIPCLG